MLRILSIPLFFLLVLQSVNAQNISAKIIDAKTGESISYANIMVNSSESLISNAEGYFTLSEGSSVDDSVLTISYLGYVSVRMTVGELRNHNLTVKMEEGVFELDTVNVSDKKLDATTIMAEVKRNLERHYKRDSQPSKDMLFYREASAFKPKKLEVEITKSTGFTKKELKSANQELSSFTANVISHPSQEFTDRLCNYYMDTKTSTPASKLEVLKATKLRDASKSVSFDDLQQKATKIFLQHLDTTKYYRIKSGLFGSHDTISLRKDYNKKKGGKSNHLISTKTSLQKFMSESSFLHSKKIDFVRNTELYDYTYEGAIYSKANEFIYVLSFKPRKSKAKYTGKLYIAEKDFAVLRTDYNLAEGKTVSGINLKFLLGVKMSENVSKGTLIFKENPVATGYYLQYASVETGQYMYLNRPLKFIELTDEERDVIAFDFKVEANTTNKMEYLNISQAEITREAFEKVTEEDFTYIPLKRYDPTIWKDYGAIEPLEEMKQFKVVE